MSDLISRAAAKFQACNWSVKPNAVIYDGIKEAIKSQLDMAPAVDAVPVVRCNDCQHRGSNKICVKLLVGTKNNFFCAFGERRDSE